MYLISIIQPPAVDHPGGNPDWGGLEDVVKRHNMTRETAESDDEARVTRAGQLNRDCFCLTLDRKALCAALEKEAGDPDFCRAHITPRANLFSNVPVFLPADSIAAMQEVVEAVHIVSRLPGYRERVLSWAPEIAQTDPGPSGVFMGFDFHLTMSGPKLIEVNTNAGGAFLNNLLLKAQVICCREMSLPSRLSPNENFREDVVDMFKEEWRLHGQNRPLRHIAIVDDEPQTQYLFPELVLAREMLAGAGYVTEIATPEVLRFEDDRLWLEGKPVDLVYNRLVDFTLEEPRHAALRMAYLTRAAAITPNPYNHALLADKRNLVLLSDSRQLEEVGVETGLREALRSVPRTMLVNPNNAEDLWRARKSLFFKPMRGYGSKAVYRGDKITRRVFEAITMAGYVAQEFAPPSERMMRVEGVSEPRKLDVRLYTYEGRTLLAAARLYQGQVTNFRTPGGGFAPVFVV